MRKKLIAAAAAVIVVIALILLGRTLFPRGLSGSRGAVATSAKPVRSSEPVDESFTEALEKFSFRSMTAFYDQKESTNLLYSPFSMYMALSILAEGSAGVTREELLELLALSEQDDVVDSGWLAEQCSILYGQLYEDSEYSSFHIANSLWIAEEVQGKAVRWNPDYLDVAAKKYYASMFSVDFAKESTGRKMGAWVSEQTGGLMKPNIHTTPTQLFAILNTIYLKDFWLYDFSEDRTKEDIFRLEDGTEVKCDFMNQITENTFYKGDGYTRASLSLKRTGKVTFVLPDEGISVEELLANQEKLNEVFTGGEAADGLITWQVPKITVSTEGDMIELLRDLGVSEMFGEEADFSEMSDREAFVSLIQQGSKLVWGEDGVEAGAYTYVAADTGSAKPPTDPQEVYMIMDRPFLYAIENEGVYLFIGVCMDPALE